MKLLLTTFIIMSITTNLIAQNQEATSTNKTFSRETAVSINIQASPEIIWALLTNASDFPRWNSTILEMSGDIKLKGKVKLKVAIDSSRTFNPKVIEFIPEKKMVWAEGAAPFFRGVRTYTLTANEDGSTTFYMHEKIKGLMFPMAAGSLPDFRPPFNQYAADLKKEAEIIQNAK